MRKTIFIADGLWQCLCPQSSQRTLSIRRVPRIQHHTKQKRLLSDLQADYKPVTTPSNVSSAPPHSKSATTWNYRPQTKEISDSRFKISPLSDSQADDKPIITGRIVSPAHLHSESVRTWNYRAQKTEISDPRLQNVPSQKAGKKETPRISIPELYDQLRVEAAKGEYGKTHRSIDLLVRVHHEQPNLRIFAAKILVNIHSELGSALAVAETLKELRSENLQPDAGLCHDILRVLAIHPDHLLQSEILEYMRQKWFTLSPIGEHDVVVGLLADHQYEMALDRIERMWNEDIVIRSWLLDLTVYVLLENEEVETAFRFMKASVNRNENSISPTAWYQLLGVASSNYHYDATVHTWRLRVESGYLNPPSGICLNVLNTAARHGDTQLATDVLRILGDRGTVFSHEHYEALIDAYATYGDIDTAFKVLSLMDNENIRPELASTRAIFHALKDRSKQTDKALESLKELKSSGQKVPAAAMNVVIEATVHQNRTSDALEQYKALHEICDQGPNTETFNVLLRGCRQDKIKAMFVASEMRALNVPTNELTYDRLILACMLSNSDDYEDAMLYYVEMKTRGWKLRRGTQFMLLKRCVEAVDMRAPEILKDMALLPDNTYISSRRWFENNWAGPPIEDLPEISDRSVRQSRPPSWEDPIKRRTLRSKNEGVHMPAVRVLNVASSNEAMQEHR
ncbi:hypothetical protein EV356DRAFT_505150 [Viridothelium virens]|uniref:Pentatricopeptide repeat-containing protein-mitochondrial domain-containing protein n=1 Tax=Viridothelium virens TaxID=1048519 RepID=A0A6A6H3E7_VIRVR|nr:hypothetical protein EV356DRAFT_505150 [Viridothelium virens]